MTIQSNMNKLSSDLKRLDNNGNYVVDDAQLMNYLQNPGMVPSYIVLAEVERRQGEQKQREMYKAMQEGAQPSVKDQAIASLGQRAPQVPAHLMSAAQPRQMSAQERAGTPGLPTLAAAGGYAPEFKEGGVVGYDQGGSVFDPDARPYTDRLLEEENSGFLNRLKQIRDFPLTRSIFGIDENNKQNALDAIDEANKEEMRLHSKPTDKQKSKIQQKKDLIEKIETQQEIDKAVAEQSEALLAEKDEDKNKTFEGATLDTGKFNTMPYDELMIENPVEYGKTLKEELRAELGDDDYKKLEKEQLGDLDKRIGGREGRKFGMAALFAGAKMMSSKDPFFAVGLGAGLEEGGKFLTQEQKEIDALKAQKLDIQTKLRMADRKEKEALNKFGAQSEQFARANNMKVSLEQQSNMLKQRELDIKEPYYKSQAGYLKTLSSQTGLAKEKLKYIETGMGGEGYLNMYNTLRSQDPSKLTDKQKRILEDLDKKYKMLEAEADAKFPSVGGNTQSTSALYGTYIPGTGFVKP